MKKTVQEMLSNLKGFKNDSFDGGKYYELMFKQRVLGSQNGAGSGYPTTAELLEHEVLHADWQETTHSAIREGCRVFTAPIGGYLGIVKLSTLDPKQELFVINPKNEKDTFGVGLVCKKGDWHDTTYLISGEVDGVEVVFTFHSGEPISILGEGWDGQGHSVGESITVQQAAEYGFEYAKAIDSQPIG